MRVHNPKSHKFKISTAFQLQQNRTQTK